MVRIQTLTRMGLLVLVLMPATGCATLFASKSTVVPMGSNPADADIYINGVRRGATPTTLELNHKQDYTVVFKRDGHEDATCQIDRSVGAGWIVLDVLGGLVPVIIDAATGAWHSLRIKNCNVNLTTVAEREASAAIEEDLVLVRAGARHEVARGLNEGPPDRPLCARWFGVSAPDPTWPGASRLDRRDRL